MRRLRPVIGLSAYVVGIAALVFWPTPVARGLGQAIDRVHRAFPIVTQGGVEFAANVIAFVPLGLLAVFAAGGHYAWVLVACIMASIGVEIAQGVFYSLRVSSAWDVLANGMGAAIGVAVAHAVIQRRQRRAGSPDTSNTRA